MHASIKPRGEPGQPAKPLMVCRISTLDDIGASVEHGAHTPRFGVYLALGGKSFIPFGVVLRAACFAASLRLAAFGSSGWPARLAFVRWVVRGGMRAVVYFATLFIAARAASRNVARVGMRFVCRAQATTAAALLGIPSSVIVQFTGGATCGRLTIHPSGRRTGAA